MQHLNFKLTKRFIGGNVYLAHSLLGNTIIASWTWTEDKKYRLDVSFLFQSILIQLSIVVDNKSVFMFACHRTQNPLQVVVVVVLCARLTSNNTVPTINLIVIVLAALARIARRARGVEHQ